MAKIEVYLRSIERFGAAGAVLTSGQSVTLRFPTGDRHATQVTPHDQLVALVREVAPPAALDAIDGNRPARFDFDSNGTRYTLAIAPKPGSWQVAIEPAAAPAPAPAAATDRAAPAQRPARVATAPTADAGDLAIERGQYAGDGQAQTTTGNPVLDTIIATARGARATDIYLSPGAAPTMRIGGELREASSTLDGETISRELGIIAPADARGAWTERGIGTFAFSDAGGRVRVTLVRDRRGPCAALRLLVGEPPVLDRLAAMPRDVPAWLDRRGVVLIAGAAGAGKTTTLAALVAALANKQRRVVTFEDPIEILHANAYVSQRAIGEHVPHLAAGIAAALREGADVIAIGEVATPAAAVALVDAAAGGQLVLATVAAGAATALDHVIELLPSHRSAFGRRVLGEAFLGAVSPVGKGAARSFEVVTGRD